MFNRFKKFCRFVVRAMLAYVIAGKWRMAV
jgi:hypothetical protein